LLIYHWLVGHFFQNISCSAESLRKSNKPSLQLYVDAACVHTWPLIKMKNLQLPSAIVTVATLTLIDLLFHMIQPRRLSEMLQSTAWSH